MTEGRQTELRNYYEHEEQSASNWTVARDARVVLEALDAIYERDRRIELLAIKIDLIQESLNRNSEFIRKLLGVTRSAEAV